MILGIGIDIVHVDRIHRWIGREGLVGRFFHPDEVADAALRGNAAALSLAARFAAKEAFGKACGDGLRGMRLKDIRVRNEAGGRPRLVFEGRALATFEALGGKSVHLSLTHERDNAVAVVILEG